jgi:hypothetical protein
MEFGDLSKTFDPQTLTSFVVAAFLVEVVMLSIFRLTKSELAGKDINRWYDVYGLDAILLDTLIVIIGFVVVSAIYPYIFADWNIIYFLILMLVVQIIHDYLFWRYVIVPIPQGHNKVIDTLKVYAENVKGGAIIGDSIMYVLGVPIASLLVGMDWSVSKLLTIGIFALYPIMYLLYTRPVKYSKVVTDTSDLITQ